MSRKYIFITGGVVSSLGKGLAAASIGALLETHQLSISLTKMDPYINVDPGTMSPFEHGEVFVTADGTETDLDIGHYERFVGFRATKDNNFTTGQVYRNVIEAERRGDFLGKTIQVVPDITNEIQRLIEKSAGDSDICIVEVGGTVGDIESLPFLETIRLMRIELGSENVMVIHTTLLPYLKTTNEIKTKPTTHSVKELRSIGIQPDMLLCRSEVPYGDDEKRKIALFSNVENKKVIQVLDVKDIHELPLIFSHQDVDKSILKQLQVGITSSILVPWRHIVDLKHEINHEITIGMVGKYTDLRDSYKSLNEAIKHAGLHSHTHIDIELIDAEKVNHNTLQRLDGIIIPGGFGERGLDGKLTTAGYARNLNIPFLGICLGMQVACIEFARNVLKLEDANSTEFDEDTNHKIFDILSILEPGHDMGGTMRLGEYTCQLKQYSVVRDAYNDEEITKERHRHRYEFNNTYVSQFEKNGMIMSGLHSKNDYILVECIELTDHPWFVGVQFHPEFTSTPRNSHPLFLSFVKAILDN